MTVTAGHRARLHVHVDGVVQGVGFRPFVHGLATGLALTGWVRNGTNGVDLEVEGSPEDLSAFTSALQQSAPPLARVEEVLCRSVPLVGDVGFSVLTSDVEGAHRVRVPADAATCAACAAEVFDPTDRRFGYALSSCTHCGPRFTIITDVPYDRARTTMAGFPMCPDCQAEYDDPADRRFHAQPVCCPVCGPTLSMTVSQAVAVLRAGQVLAVKGLGGYHLATLAGDETAVARLRERKHRMDRPFAVMVPDLDAARELCRVGPEEERLLTGVARPIVLLERHEPAGAIAPSVAPGQRTLGLLLPYTPLHHLLMAELRAPLVLTSGNRSEEPIAHDDDDALARLTGIADAFLSHDRPIHTRVDDSVVKVVRKRVVPIRRSRGYVPSSVRLPVPLRRPTLACGAQLKNTFALGRDCTAYVSQHVGDLDDWPTFQSYLTSIELLSRLVDIRPELVVHDLHPDYASTTYAQGLPEVELLGVQHHHAHIASCLADNGLDEPVIGVAFDGTGWGPDGTLWGGEILHADLREAERVAHLQVLPLPGGEAAIREPWRMAAVYLGRAFPGALPDLPVTRHDNWDAITQLAASDLCPTTSSAGRLFDAVAATLGVRDEVTYEGQAAIELEQLADPSAEGSYELPLDGTTLDGTRLVRAVVDDLLNGTPRTTVAARFHSTLALAVAELCDQVRGELSTVALSGGVWQNSLLLERTLDALEQRGLTVLTHREVPCNDGGISLGQLAIAARRD